ncbi:MAG: hypothetical protein H7Z39_10595 [Burkholderiaceae bacterium]|nr:hypothetical protein [Burkholderiaceae bacterium]
MRYKLIMLCVLLGSGAPAMAQVSVSIGINLPSYPQMARVPGYPVYYASGVNSNLFFYDGMYWAYQGDNWYASSWYNGPWEMVSPYFVPQYVLRVPVRYYRSPPRHFNSWSRNAAPRWNEHWGDQWAQRRNGWDRWNRNAAPAPAPLPSYQRQYAGNRYPRAEQQQQLQSQNYRYQPRDAIVRQRAQEQHREPAASRPSRTDAQDMRQNRDLATPSSTRMRDGAGDMRGQQRQGRDDYSQRSAPPRQAGPGNAEQRPQQQQQPREQQMRPQAQAQPQQVQPQQVRPQQAAQPRAQEHQAPAQREQGMRGQENRGDPGEHRRGQGRDKERDGDGERGQRHDRGNN